MPTTLFQPSLSSTDDAHYPVSIRPLCVPPITHIASSCASPQATTFHVHFPMTTKLASAYTKLSAATGTARISPQWTPLIASLAYTAGQSSSLNYTRRPSTTNHRSSLIPMLHSRTPSMSSFMGTQNVYSPRDDPVDNVHRVLQSYYYEVGSPSLDLNLTSIATEPTFRRTFLYCRSMPLVTRHFKCLPRQYCTYPPALSNCSQVGFLTCCV